MLGKATIDTRTHGKTKGRSGSYSTNYQNSGRELLTGDEVRLLDNDYALLFVRGERAVIDRKYDIMKHPNIKRTEDGGAEAYAHQRAVPDYSLPDLPYGEEDLEYIEIMEDPDEEGETDETEEEGHE